MAKLICTQCGSMGDLRKDTRGSIFIEIILWLCFIVPGLVYSIWRLTTRRWVCHTCGSAALVPVDTPVGQQLLAKLNNK